MSKVKRNQETIAEDLTGATVGKQVDVPMDMTATIPQIRNGYGVPSKSPAFSPLARNPNATLAHVIAAPWAQHSTAQHSSWCEQTDMLHNQPNPPRRARHTQTYTQEYADALTHPQSGSRHSSV